MATNQTFIQLNFSKENLIDPLKQELSRMTGIVFEQLEDIGENVLDASQNLVPIDTGALKGSGFITSDKGDLTITIGYGGDYGGINPESLIPVEEYALQVHEDLDMNHPNGGSAKFLEIPANFFFRDAKQSTLGDNLE